MNKVILQVAMQMQQLLTETADALGRSSGFIQRQRKWSGASFAQTLGFGWLGKADATMEELSQSAANVGVYASRQALDQRFTPAAVAFMGQLWAAGVERMLQLEGVASASGLLNKFEGVYVLDSTVISLPDELREVFAGCTGAAVKVSVCWNIQHGLLKGVQVHAGREHDQTSELHTLRLPAGSLRLADLGYLDLAHLAQMTQDGVYWISRYKVGTSLFRAHGQPFDLVAYLQSQPCSQPQVAWSGQWGANQRLSVRGVAVRLSAATRRERQAKLRDWERKHQQRASAERWFLTAWEVWLTNVLPSLLTDTQIPQVARLRWQIELLFKLWKSEGQLDQWQTHNPHRILCELYAKLLALLIQHWLLLLGACHDLQISLTQAARTIQKKAWHIASVLAEGGNLLPVLQHLQRCFHAGCRISRSASSTPSFQRLEA